MALSDREAVLWTSQSKSPLDKLLEFLGSRSDGGVETFWWRYRSERRGWGMESPSVPAVTLNGFMVSMIVNILHAIYEHDKPLRQRAVDYCTLVVEIRPYLMVTRSLY